MPQGDRLRYDPDWKRAIPEDKRIKVVNLNQAFDGDRPRRGNPSTPDP